GLPRTAGRSGGGDRGRAGVGAMWERIGRVADAGAGRRRPRVFVSEWLEPPFAAGHWLPEMVAFAGGEDVLGRAGEPSFQTSWAAVAEQAPELIVLASCGYDAGRIAAEAAEVRFPAPA